MELIVQINEIAETFPKSDAEQAASIVGKPVMLTGFWRRKEDFHNVHVGDVVSTGVEHQQVLSDNLSVIEQFEKVEVAKVEEKK